MAGVELLSQDRAPLLAQPYYESGDPGPIAAALAQVPELMEPALAFIGAVFGPGSVDPRLREMVVLRVSSANGCHYCTQVHAAIAGRMGFGPEELAALTGVGPAPPGWSAVQRAVFDFSEALSHQPSAAVPLLRAHFGDPEIVELVALGSATVMLNRFATALELPV